jgi:hypothetical protein
MPASRSGDDRALETPVALILFRRPERTARIFERIREARPRRLFLIADGPRTGDAEERAGIDAARAAVDEIDWPCEVSRDYAERNLGLKRRITTGLGGVFEEEERAIVLEDDCLPHPAFFRYCDELLERYRSEERVVHIAGSQLLRRPPSGASFHFSRYVHIWGWATWRRAWSHFDVDLAEWHGDSDEGRERRLRNLFADESERRYWRYVWDNSREIDNWDAQWSYVCLTRRALAVNPNRNLISNIGFGPDATNARDDPFGIGGRPLEGMDFPLKAPGTVARDERADAEASQRFFRHEAPGPPPSRIAEGMERWRWRLLRAGGRALDLLPARIRPRIRHRDRADGPPESGQLDQ